MIGEEREQICDFSKKRKEAGLVSITLLEVIVGTEGRELNSIYSTY